MCLTLVGQNWNQLVYELSKWHELGKELEKEKAMQSA